MGEQILLGLDTLSGRYLALPNGQFVALTESVYILGRVPRDLRQQTTVGDHKSGLLTSDGDRILIDDLGVSKRHAVLTRTKNGEYAVEDAHSRCGTFVNGRQLRAKTEMKAGDQLTLGPTKLSYMDAPPSLESPWEKLGSD